MCYFYEKMKKNTGKCNAIYVGVKKFRRESSIIKSRFLDKLGNIHCIDIDNEYLLCIIEL